MQLIRVQTETKMELLVKNKLVLFKFYIVKGFRLIFIIAFLFSGLSSSPANAAKRECTNAQKALVQNLRQQVVILSNQITYMKSRRDAANERYKASLGDLSYKVEFDNFNAQVSRADRDMKSKEQQILNVTGKCKFTSSSSSTGVSNLKICTSSEKKAISSVVQNFQGVQTNKNSWDNKLNVAKSWSQDYSKPSGIRAQAALDTQRYSDLYQEELAVEEFIVEQYNLLNSSCKNSGIELPKPYLTLDQRINNVNKESGAQIIQVVDESRDLSGGPFYITQNEDSSLTINCTKPVWGGLDLSKMSLFLAGSNSTNPLFTDVFMKSRAPINWLFNPVIRLQASLKIGNNIGTMNFSGKFISSESKSVCGLVTEKLGDLTKNFASDVISVGLLLKTSTEAAPDSITSQQYTFMGGVVLPENKSVTKPNYFIGYNKNSDGTTDLVCGVSNHKEFDWSRSSVKVQVWGYGSGYWSPRGDIFKITGDIIKTYFNTLPGPSISTEFRGQIIRSNERYNPYTKMLCTFLLNNKAGRIEYEEVFGPLVNPPLN